MIIAFAVARLRGNGGHEPAQGLKGLATGSLVIVTVVVAYITGLVLSARLEGKRATSGSAPLGPRGRSR